MREDVRFKINNDDFLLSDYHLCVESYSIGIPEVKSFFQEIPYSNVVYDYTEYFGSPTYSQRTITINCKIMKSTPCWQKIMQKVLELMHGQRGTFSFASDSEWYYNGRISIGTDDHDNWNFATVTLSIICDPLKTNMEGASKL